VSLGTRERAIGFSIATICHQRHRKNSSYHGSHLARDYLNTCIASGRFVPMEGEDVHDQWARCWKQINFEKMNRSSHPRSAWLTCVGVSAHQLASIIEWYDSSPIGLKIKGLVETFRQEWVNARDHIEQSSPSDHEALVGKLNSLECSIEQILAADPLYVVQMKVTLGCRIRLLH
jgi:hypothetical protein